MKSKTKASQFKFLFCFVCFFNLAVDVDVKKQALLQEGSGQDAAKT